MPGDDSDDGASPIFMRLRSRSTTSGSATTEPPLARKVAEESSHGPAPPNSWLFTLLLVKVPTVSMRRRARRTPFLIASQYVGYHKERREMSRYSRRGAAEIGSGFS